MPKLTNHQFSFTTEDKQTHHFNSEIYVCTEGEFSCTVPEFLVETLTAVANANSNIDRKRHVQKLQVNHRAYAPSKSDLLAFVNEAHRQHYMAVITTDLVICYDWHAEVSYWQNPDGSMAANGSMPDAVDRTANGDGGNWANHVMRSGQNINANNRVGHYSIGVFAAIYQRTTHTRLSGVTETWGWINQFGHDKQLGEWGNKLSGFTGLSEPKSPEYLRQMPYTESAARFFYESLMGMCEMGRRFKNFFEDEANVIAAIEGHGPSLLPAPSATTHQEPATTE